MKEGLFGRVTIDGFEDMEFYRFGFWMLARCKGHARWFFWNHWSKAEFRQFQKESERAAHQAKRISKKVA